MRSEELAALAGDIKPVDLGPVHHRARDEVVRLGKATGKEYGVAVFVDGRILSFGGDHENRIDVPPFDAPPGSVTIHHNHPSGDSFSRADLRVLLERPDLGRIDAHGHEGLWASCERVGGSLTKQNAILAVEDAASQARSLIAKKLGRHELAEEVARASLWQVVMSLLLERQGVLRYALNAESIILLARQVLK
ncbi:hypothetical protein [uncultured Thiocystis sp.]|jgi:hypothetical protein|uniref:hypothetical protein n=1 Tax=uncultured Thiocystis sp. TaxID=1202134 RepID=UPI0025EE9637|nr:hypothetical protein [uncultured Thiocystis sp.]